MLANAFAILTQSDVDGVGTGREGVLDLLWYLRCSNDFKVFPPIPKLFTEHTPSGQVRIPFLRKQGRWKQAYMDQWRAHANSQEAQPQRPVRTEVSVANLAH